MDARRQKFVANVCAGMSQADAARDAGFSAKTARQIACKLMKDPEIAAAVAKDTKKHVEKAGLTADFVLSRLKRLARRAEKDSDKVAALGLLGKHLKLFTDKVELSGGLTLEQLVPRKKVAP